MDHGRTLTSLAFVYFSWSNFNFNYIDCFTPFVSSVLKNNDWKSLEEIKTLIKNIHGLDIPFLPLKSIVNRAKKKRFIILDKGKYKVNIENNMDMSGLLADNINECEKDIIKITGSIKKFVESKIGESFSQEEIEKSFLKFIDKYDEYFVGNGTNQEDISKNKKNQLIHFIAKFVFDIKETDKNLFDDLIKIVIGQVLSKVIFRISDAQGLNRYEGSLKNVKVYLDTRLILRLFNFEGQFYKELSIELIGGLDKEHAEIFVSPITKNEIDIIIWELIKVFDGKTDRDKAKRSELLSYEIDKAALEFLRANLDSRINSYGIKTEDKMFEKCDYSHQIKPSMLQETINIVYKNFNPAFSEENERNRIARDVDVISGIYQIRKGKVPHSLPDTKAIFITNNYSLCKAVRQFDLNHTGASESLFSPAMTDVFIGTLLWVQAPAKAIEVNKKRLIAYTYSIVKPSLLCLEKFMSIIKNLKDNGRISADEYNVALTNTVASGLLEDYEICNPEDIEIDTAENIVKKMFEKLKETADSKTRIKDAELSRIKSDILEKIKGNTSKIKNKEISVKKRVKILLKVIDYILNILLLVILIAIYLVKGNALIPFIILYVLVSFLNLKIGFTLDLLKKKIELKLSNWFIKKSKVLIIFNDELKYLQTLIEKL